MVARLVIHNAAFEIVMLGGRPRDVVDSMQLAGLLYGTERGARRLANVAEAALGLEVPKDLQVSDWSAARLSGAQLAYAGLDAVVAHSAAGVMYRGLDPEARRAFAVQNAAVPVIAGMRLWGIPFDPQIHRETVAGWEREQADARALLIGATGEDVPPQGRKRSAWLERRLADLGANELRRWSGAGHGDQRARPLAPG